MRVTLLLFFTLIMWASAPHAQVAKSVYLAPYDGTGTDSDPFRPRGMDALTSCINLRPDPTQATGWAICSRDVRPAGAGYVTIADVLNERLSAARKQALQDNILGGSSLTATTLDSILAEILIDKASVGRKLLRSRDGKYHIWLGGQTEVWKQTAWLYDEYHIEDNGLVADATNAVLGVIEPAVAWAASLSENWNCANSGSLTCQLTWVDVNGTAWSIASNQASCIQTGGVHENREDTALDTNDMEVSATLISLTGEVGSFTRGGVIGRKDNTATRTFYIMHADRLDDVMDSWDTASRVAGTFSSIAVGGTPALNDVMKLRIDGSVITGLVNGAVVVGPSTNTDITADNRYAGIYCNNTSGTDKTVVLDGWDAIDYTSSFGPLQRRY